MLKVGLLLQEKFGGTDRILLDFSDWLDNNSNMSYDLKDMKAEEIYSLDMIILPTSEMYRLWKTRKLIHKNCKIIIWCMGHDALQASFFNSSISNFLYRQFFRFLYGVFFLKNSDKNLFIYTDLIGENLDRFNFNMSLKENSNNIYQIPIHHVNTLDSYKKKVDRQVKSFFWIGRVDKDFKVWSLLALLEMLENLSLDMDFEFKIVGDGDSVDLIDPNKYSFDVFRLGNLSYEELTQTIKEEADIVFAMGTSALEGAKNSVPTILVSPLIESESNRLPELRWIYNSVGYTLGEFRKDKVYPQQVNEELSALISQYQKNPFSCAEKSFRYSESFSRERVFSELCSNSDRLASFGKIENTLFVPYISYKIKNFLKSMLR